MPIKKPSIIIKFDCSGEQTVGEITKIVGLTRARFLISIIDALDLEANPRSAKTGPVTDAIQESIENDPRVFPFKTKGVLLASSRYDRLERNRIRITPESPEIEGILDGGHNTLAIGLYILNRAMQHKGIPLPRNTKTWDVFKELWQKNRDIVDEYLDMLRREPDNDALNFFVPIELLVPRDAEDGGCVESFKSDLLEICAARNNNVQLQVSAKANQRGYFDTLKSLMESYDADVNRRIEWKTNDGGEVKVQDLVALAWIPLSLINPVRDCDGRTVEPVSPQKIYSAKGSCLSQFERLMSSPEVTLEVDSDYRRELFNPEVLSAFEVAVQLPKLYDYIYEMFPKFYNFAGGSYGRITAVKRLNENRREKKVPFTAKTVETLSPDGFIAPLVYGLQALMENAVVDGHSVIRWKQEPMDFLRANLEKVVVYYAGIFSMCDYDPQKIGKNAQSYTQALSGYKMTLAGIL
ncbi:hypothetical protein H8K20_00735 [Neobittarella massiliensis]|uniref:AIPR protein n=1 Tax=Neobittarella massiliensis (ex Bilen et al. 2018) TaxID=2041842 RepID=A0A8J6IIA6_9FIRM|nr:hypothetical protein [Neobittarella massiliensis]MBC3514916.1 hypothetical protein [Neobittarella massiliensis]